MKLYDEFNHDIYPSLYENLKQSNVLNPFSDLLLMVMKVCSISKINALTEKIKLSTIQKNELLEMIKKRSLRVPLAYILQTKNFLHLDLYVDENVLIPRPETEMLVMKASELIKQHHYTEILEIGTGSGCISLSLMGLHPHLKITAVDISDSALLVAKKNAKQLLPENSILFLKSDLFSAVTKTYDMIISNPPYIPLPEYENLEKELYYEPKLALEAGMDGLHYYRKMIGNAKKYLKEKSCLIFEIGYNQYDALEEIMTENNFDPVYHEKDLQGFKRIVFSYR